MIRRLSRYLIFFVFLFVCSGGLGSRVKAQPPEAIPAQWTVASIYFDPLNNRWQKQVHWTFRTDDQGRSISVADDSQRMGVTALMQFDDSSSLIQVTRKGRMGTRRYSLERVFDAAKPAVIEDALVPCNWLNEPQLWRLREPSEYVVTETVTAKNRFAIRLRVVYEAIEIAVAVDRDMLRSQMAAGVSDQLLTLVRIEKIIPGKPNQTIVIQLWASDTFFWLYEETPSRRSYYVGDGE